MHRNRVGVVVAAVGLVAAACSGGGTSHPAAPATTPTTTAPPAPPQYQPLIATLAGRIADLGGRADKATARGATVLGAELLNANGNVGPALLAPTAINGAITVLDRFQHLGIRGVTVEVGFPMLLPSFANSPGYLTFYEQVAAAVHQRHMQLDVELNPAFPGFTSLPVEYAGLTLQTYAAQQAQEAQIIIDHLQPTYLTILDETDTFAAHLRLPLNNPTAAVGVLNTELATVHRGRTKIGGGTGTWEGPAIDQALLSQTSIDYLSVHVYPIDANSLDNLDADFAAATAAHKPVVMDETWLFKEEAPGISGGTNQQQAATLNTYGFFAPQDDAFLHAIVAYSRRHGAVYVSPFWTGQFFAYLPWTPELDREPFAQLFAAGTNASQAAIHAGRFTNTGYAYGKLSGG